MEPYPSRQFGFFDNPDRQLGNGSVWTRTRTRSDGLEPLLTRLPGPKIPLTMLLEPKLSSPKRGSDASPQQAFKQALK